MFRANATKRAKVKSGMRQTSRAGSGAGRRRPLRDGYFFMPAPESFMLDPVVAIFGFSWHERSSGLAAV